MDERRSEQADAEEVDDRRRVGAGAFRLEDRLFDGGCTAAAPLFRPVETEVTGVVELALPGTPNFDQAIFTRIGSDRHGSPGPGGATFTGTVSNANTASVARLRSTWLAWLGEHVLGFARPAYAQARDTSLGGITVIVRGGGREVSDLTDSSGGFVVSDAPTGEVSVLFRRGSCEGSLPIGGVVSTSTLTLVVRPSSWMAVAPVDPGSLWLRWRSRPS